MKGFAKFLLICAVILFFSGLLLTLLALALGSDSHLVRQRLAEVGVVRIFNNLPEWKGFFEKEHTSYSWDLLSPDLPKEVHAGEYEIKNLVFTFALGDVRITTGEDFGLIYGSEQTRRFYSERKSGDTWIISSNHVRWNWLRLWDYRQDDIKLTVVLPKDFVAQNMIISMGAGNMQAGYLWGKEIQLDVGLGNCQIGSFNAEEARLSVGVGYLEVKHFTAGQATLDVGLGSVELDLTQPLEQYRCRVEVALGSVQLGSNTYSGTADASSGPADAPYSLHISCGLGNVNVRPPLTMQI